MIVRKLTSALIGAGMLIPGIAGALGLGGIDLNSGLNQPLNADIHLSRVGDLVEEEIRIKLAGYDDFEKAGVERVYFLTGFKFDVQIKPDGSGVIHVSSKKPVKEPFLNFIIEMQWPQGRLLREYTVLLDPPVFNDQAQMLLVNPPTASKVVEQQAIEQAVVESTGTVEVSPATSVAAPIAAPAVAPAALANSSDDGVDIYTDLDDLDYESEEIIDDEGEKKTESFDLSENNDESALIEEDEPALKQDEPVLEEEKKSVAVIPSVSQDNPDPLSGTYGRVARDENLWQISNKVKPNGLTAQQTMLAIKKMNSQAFMNDNINDLKAGYVLRLPTYEEIAEIDAQMAVRMVANENQQWLARTGKIDDLDSMPLDSGEYAETQTEVENNEGDARLKLLAANTYSDSESGSLGARDGEGGSANSAQIEDELLKTEEALDRSELENQELTSRLDDVEAQVETSNEIIDLKDNQIAALQAKLRKLEEEAGADESELTTIDEPVLEVESDEVELDIESVVETPSVSDSQGELQDTDESATDESITTESITTDPVPVEEPEASSDVTPPVKKPELGMVEKLTESAKEIASNPMYMLAGGAALILLLAGGFIMMRKSREDDEFDDEDQDDELEFSLSNGLDSNSDSDVETETDDSDESEELYMKQEASGSSETSDEKEKDAELEEFQGTAEEAIGEADIYIAYGRHSHAVEILNQVLAKEPNRLDLMKKLLEVYGEMDDKTAYAELETRINATEDSSSEDSSSEANTPSMSLEDEQDSPMSFFDEPKEETAVVDEADGDLSFDIEDETGLNDLQSNLDAVENDLETSLDVELTDESDLDSASKDKEESEFLMEEDDSFSLDDDVSVNELESLEFSLDEEDLVDLEADQDSDEIESSDFEFSLDAAENDNEHEVELKEVELKEVGVEATTPEVESNNESEYLLDDTDEDVQPLDDIQGDAKPAEGDFDESLDLNAETEIDISAEQGLSSADDDDDFDFLNDVDEAATKLDLARAYIDMGDKDGAKDILEEVISEGDENQKKDANELLQRIA